MVRPLVVALTLLGSLADAATVLAQAPAPPTGTAAPIVGGTAPAPGAPAQPGQAVKPGAPPAAPPEPAVSRQMFRWVDKDGVMHYSDTPPQPKDQK